MNIQRSNFPIAQFDKQARLLVVQFQSKTKEHGLPVRYIVQQLVVNPAQTGQVVIDFDF